MFHKLRRRIPIWGGLEWGGLAAGTIVHFMGTIDEDDLEDMAGVAHELTHVVQERAQGQMTMSASYLGQFAWYTYYKVSYEAQAYAVQGAFRPVRYPSLFPGTGADLVSFPEWIWHVEPERRNHYPITVMEGPWGWRQ